MKKSEFRPALEWIKLLSAERQQKIEAGALKILAEMERAPKHAIGRPPTEQATSLKSR